MLNIMITISHVLTGSIKTCYVFPSSTYRNILYIVKLITSNLSLGDLFKIVSLYYCSIIFSTKIVVTPP